MRVFMILPRFRPLVVSGEKCQTIRLGRRAAARGELLSLRGWLGVPYRSCQYELVPPTPCLASAPVSVEIYTSREVSIYVGDDRLSAAEVRDFALADGFGSLADFVAHWRDGEGLTKFDGRLITWAPPAPGRS